MLDLIIRDFKPAEQQAVKTLVLAGLAARWGYLEPGLNPDLNAIGQHYRAGHVLVGLLDDMIVACGMLTPHGKKMTEIVRMSVATAHRRQGLGRKILDALVARARQTGHRQIILETTKGWDDAVAFYESYGFKYTHFLEGEFGGQLHFALDLVPLEANNL